MNKSFLRFSDSAVKAGLFNSKSSLGQELKYTTELFVSLSKSAQEGNHEGEDDVGEVELDPATEFHNAALAARATRDNGQARAPPVPQHTNVGWGYSTSLDESLPPITAASPQSEPRHLPQTNYFAPITQTPYEAATQSSLTRVRSRPMTIGQIYDQSKLQTDNNKSDQQLPFGLVDIIMRDRDQWSYPSSPPRNPQVFSINIPSPNITPPLTRLPTPPSLSTRTLAPNWTYSHDETTFARRLTRAALETGFHLLSTASLRPAAFNHVFKLSLPYMPYQRLHERFKMLLSRGTEEDLEGWETPFIHLGGAGTHYPRKDAKGNTVTIKNAWTVRTIGSSPTKMIRAENTEDPSRSHDLNIDLTGYEGDWFDAGDVQGYLEEEKGCHIDPRDSFTEVVIEVEDDTNPTGLNSFSFSKNANVNLDFSDTRKSTHQQSESPALSHGSDSTESSSKSTPGNSAGGADGTFGQSDAPFGLDMSVGGYSFGKFSDLDPSSFLDQPLGLDLAPGFDDSLNAHNLAAFNAAAFGDMNLGLDLMAGDMPELPVVKPKIKKAAWIDVSKLINGEFLRESFLRPS